MSGFSPTQLKKLTGKLDRAHVQQRKVDGRAIDYIEGWFAVSEANAIFGYANWDRETVHSERLFERTKGEVTSCAYAARIRIKVRANGTLISREGTGCGSASSRQAAEAHDLAIKAAETDATKRALATFGNRFGLCLYDKDQQGVSSRAVLEILSQDGTVFASGLSPEGFCTALRKLIESASDRQELLSWQERNASAIQKLRVLAPALKTQAGTHYADVLERMFRARLAAAGVERKVEQAQADRGELTKSSIAEEVRQALLTAGGHPATLKPIDGSSDRPNGSKLKRCSNDRTASLGGPGFVGWGNAALRARESVDSAAVEIPLATSVETAPADQNIAVELDRPDEGRAVAAVSLPRPSSVGPLLPMGIEQNPESPSLQHESVAPSRIAAGPRIDKASLVVATPRRIRDKAHLRSVGTLPCLVCRQTPSHPHHLTFAQPRGLALKVSDEFVVPLCAEHHNDLHRLHPETAWWKRVGINPVPIAAELWQKHVHAAEYDEKR